MHTVKPFMPESSASEVEVAIGKLKSYPGFGKIPAELIQVVGETLCLGVRKLSELIWNKEELPQWWKISCCTYSQRCDKTD
jgi:hypothetical protein